VRKAICILMLLQAPFLLGARTPDEELEVCKAKCATEFAACRAEVPTEASKAKDAEETRCGMELDACNSDCDEARTLAGMIRKMME